MNFDIAFDRLMGNEGGYTSGEGDPGGETQWGISKRSYPDLDIRALTRDQAKEIYRRDFWAPIHGDDLAAGVAFQTFDLAANSGVSVAIKALQRALGVPDDGAWGPVTHDAAAAANAPATIMRLVADMIDHWTSLKTWPNFGRGWARRARDNLRYGAEDVANG